MHAVSVCVSVIAHELPPSFTTNLPITPPLIPLTALGDLTGFSPRMIVLKPGFPGYSDTLDKAAEESCLVRTTCADPSLRHVFVVVCDELVAVTSVQLLFKLKCKTHHTTPHHTTPHHTEEAYSI